VISHNPRLVEEVASNQVMKSLVFVFRRLTAAAGGPICFSPCSEIFPQHVESEKLSLFYYPSQNNHSQSSNRLQPKRATKHTPKSINSQDWNDTAVPGSFAAWVHRSKFYGIRLSHFIKFELLYFVTSFI
jgi:hypothetical protein